MQPVKGTGDAGIHEVSLTAAEAIRTPAFWLLETSTNLAAIAIFGVNLHMFSYLTDTGLSVGVAAGILRQSCAGGPKTTVLSPTVVRCNR